MNRAAFFGMYGFVLTISILKAYLFFIVVNFLSSMTLTKPFSSSIAGQITQIRYFTLLIGLASYGARKTAVKLHHPGFKIGVLDQFWGDSQAYMLMSAVIYMIAAIFSRRVEIQKENDLTV